jgi:hypothetical protein
MRQTVKPTAVRKEIRRLERYLNDLKIMPATAVFRSAVLLPLLSKTLTTARAVCASVEAGFPAEAFATTRTLLEIFFTVRYFTNKDTEKRIERYVKYFARVRVEWKKVIEEHLPVSAAHLKALDPEIVKHAKEFKSKSQWNEEGVILRVMAMEPDTFEVDDHGIGINSKFDYDAIYFWTSQYVHTTVEAMEGHAVAPGEVFKVRARIEKERDLGNTALFNVCVFTCKTFVYALRCIKEEQPKALDDLFKLLRVVEKRDEAARQKTRP